MADLVLVGRVFALVVGVCVGCYVMVQIAQRVAVRDVRQPPPQAPGTKDVRKRIAARRMEAARVGRLRVIHTNPATASTGRNGATGHGRW